MRQKKKHSFTLVELLITIVIIGILATLALPNFRRSREQVLGREAQANLKLIAAAERIYRMEYGTYWPTSGDLGDIANINTNLKLLLGTAETNWDYTITTTGLPNPSFTITAARQGAGGLLDCVYTFDDDDADGEPDPQDCP